MKIRNKIQSYAAIWALTSILAVSCQNDPFPVYEYGSISGVILDSKTNLPIEGVTVSTTPGSSTTTSNSKGEYKLEAVKTGTVTLNTNKLNYTPYSAQLEVRKDATTTANFSMDQDLNTVGTISIKGTIPDSNAVNVKSITTFKWSVSREAPIDTITYQLTITDVEKKIQKVYTNISDTSYLIRDLGFATKYTWKVSAVHNEKIVATSTIKPFITITKPNLAIFFSVSSSDGLYQIYAMDRDSTYVGLVTENYSKTAFAPILYKNQDLVLFTSYQNDLPYVFAMRRDGSGIMKVSPYPNMSAYSIGNGYAFYNHGASLLYTYMDKLFAVNTDGTQNQVIATAPTNRQFTSVDWCPETEKIVVKTVGPMPYESEFYIMNDDGTNMRLLVGNTSGMLQSPSFSPNGKYLVYAKDVSGVTDISGEPFQSHLFLKNLSAPASVDIDLTARGNVTVPTGSNDLYPRFAPDNRQIIFVNRSNLGGSIGNIVITDIINGGRTTIKTGGTYPFWAI